MPSRYSVEVAVPFEIPRPSGKESEPSPKGFLLLQALVVVAGVTQAPLWVKLVGVMAVVCHEVLQAALWEYEYDFGH